MLLSNGKISLIIEQLNVDRYVYATWAWRMITNYNYGDSYVWENRKVCIIKEDIAVREFVRIEYLCKLSFLRKLFLVSMGK